jgi:hypothetical protein
MEIRAGVKSLCHGPVAVQNGIIMDTRRQKIYNGIHEIITRQRERGRVLMYFYRGVCIPHSREIEGKGMGSSIAPPFKPVEGRCHDAGEICGRSPN